MPNAMVLGELCYDGQVVINGSEVTSRTYFSVLGSLLKDCCDCRGEMNRCITMAKTTGNMMGREHRSHQSILEEINANAKSLTVFWAHE